MSATAPDPESFLYLSDTDVQSLDITPDEVADAVEAAFAALGRGAAANVAKSAVDPAPDTFFHAMPALLRWKGLTGLKWVGVSQNADSGLPHVNALLTLSDMTTGAPVAVMSANWITGVRPPAVTLAAARRLARTDSETVGFVACGLQARTHLAALMPHFPLKRAICFSRRRETTEAFADHARTAGLEATIVDDPGDVIQADIVVTSVPRGPDVVRTLDARQCPPGVFVSGTDLARTWIGEHINAFDLVATDDIRQSREQAVQGLVPWQDRFDVELSDLILGKHPGRTSPEERIMFVHPGMALGDAAVGALVLERALAVGTGQRLSR